jgi:hypothetical protein
MDWAVVNGYGPIVKALRRRGAAHSEDWQQRSQHAGPAGL